MRDNTIRTIAATVVLFGIAVVALLQIGPGGDPTISLVTDAVDPTQDAPATSETESPDTTAAPEPFFYRVGVLSGVTTDNFWAFYGREATVWDAYILGPTKPALYAPDPATGTLRPELAISEVTPNFDADGWHVLVDLNEALSWSDGQPVTAGDIVFTFDTVRRLELEGSWAQSFPDVIESMHANGPHELRIEFSQRPSLAVWPHGPGLAPIMPAHVWGRIVEGLSAEELYEVSGTADLGGGPLTLSTVGEDLVVSVSNPGYLLASSPDVVEYHVYANEAEMVAAVASGDIDSILTPKGLTQDQLEIAAANPAVAVESSPSNSIRYLGFNLNREPMSDQAFRTALALLLDREGLAEAIPSTGSVPYSFVTAANTSWFVPDAAESNANRYSGDLATRLGTALEGLRQAEYAWVIEPTLGPDGQVVSGSGLTIRDLSPEPLTILTSGDAYDPSRPIYAQEIADALGLLGFDVRPIETDFDTVVDLAFTPGEDGLLHYDMYLLGWTLGNPSLPGYYRHLFAADGALNNTGYDSATFAEQLAIFESAFGIEQARDALWSMEAILAADLPYLLLYTTEITEIYRSDRVTFAIEDSLGGLQGRLGGIGDVRPVS